MTVVVVAPPTAKLPTTGDAVTDAAVAAALGLYDGPAGTLGRAILPQTLEMRMPGWGPRHDLRWDSGDLLGSYGTPLWAHEHHWRHHGAIEIPFPPAIKLVSITYADPTGADQVLPPSAYVLQIDGDEARVLPAFGTTWPAALMQPDSIRIRYVAGYQDANGDAAVPPGIVLAVTMQGRMLASLGGRDAFTKSEQVTGIGSASYDTGTGGGASTQTAIDRLLDPYRIP